MSARLLIVGPQGSGKGTQGVRIAEAFGIPVVSTGDVFRANVAQGTELGQQVKAIIDGGSLVPDELTSAVVRDRLSQADAAEGFLLDGYPRNLAQVMHLDEFLEGRDESLDAVIARRASRGVAVASHRTCVRAGPRRRHRGGDRHASGHLRARDGAHPRRVRHARVWSTRSTASAVSTR